MVPWAGWDTPQENVAQLPSRKRGLAPFAGCVLGLRPTDIRLLACVLVVRTHGGEQSAGFRPGPAGKSGVRGGEAELSHPGLLLTGGGACDFSLPSLV